MEELIRSLGDFVSRAGILGMFGGVAAYIHSTIKGNQQFSWWVFLGNMFLAYYVGTVSYEFFKDSEHAAGIASVAGYCAFPILNVLEAWVTAYLKKNLPK